MPLYRAELRRRTGLLPPVLIHDLSQVLYLPFDKDDGSYARDRSGYNRHGTIYGGSRVPGKIGLGYEFDGYDDRVLCSGALKEALPNLSLTFWQKVPPVADWSNLVCRAPDWGAGGFLFNIAPGHALCFQTADLTPTGYGGTKVVDDESWHFIMVTVDADYVTFYVDMELDIAQPITSGSIGPSVTGDIHVATRPGLTSYLAGILDEVRIWRRILSQAEGRRIMYLRGV